LELLSLHDLGDVEVEEVAVEDGLDAAGHDRDDVIERLSVVPVDPVENVEAPVGPEREQVVGGDWFRLAGLRHHEQLRQDGNWLQVDGEGPEDLHDGELVVEGQGQQDAGAKEELNPEGVVVSVVGGLELDVHQVDRGGRGSDKEHLHCGVVDGYKVREKI